MPEWITPLINTVVTPLLVLMVGLLGWVVAEFRADFKKTKELAAKVPALEDAVDDLKREKATAETERDTFKRDLDTERLEHTQTKQALDKARADHKADITRLNDQHVKDIADAVNKAVTKAVDEETRKHQTTIDNLKRENTEAIGIAVKKAVDEAVKPLNDQIDELKKERDTLQERVSKIEKKDTGQLGIRSDSGD